MSKELMYILINKMHIKLNDLIETNNYDLLCEKVQRYSKRMDKVLTLYNKLVKKNYQNNLSALNSNKPVCSYKFKIHS